MKQKPKRRKSIVLRILALGVAVYLIVSLTALVDDLAEVKAEYDSVNEEYNSKMLYRDEMKELIESDSYDAIIEKAARERLGYVYGDETIYIDNSGN